MAGSGQERESRPRRSTSFDGRVLRLLVSGERALQHDFPFGRAFGWFAAALLIVFLVALAAHGTYISANPLDYLFMIEQGYRLDQGQLPYRDFITPVGPVYYALIGILQHLSGGDPAAYRLTGFLALLLVGPGLIWLAWRRLPGNVALFISLALAILPVSPREMDGFFFDFEFLAIYNSLCWPLLATVILGALFDPIRPTTSKQSLLDGLALGLALVLLLGLKASHGLVGCGVLLTGLVLRPRNRPALLIAAGVLFVTLGLAYAAAGEMLRGYVHDLALIGRVNSLPERLRLKLHLFVYQGTATLLMAVAVIWLIDKYRQFHPTRVRYADALAAIVIFGAIYADATNDHEDTPAAIPLLFVLLWLIGSRVNLPIGGDAGRRYRRAKTCLLALPFILWAGLPLANDGVSLVLHSVNAWLRPPTTWPADLPAKAPDLAGLKILGTLEPGTLGNAADPMKTDDQRTAYLLALQDAVNALQQAHLDHARIYEARFNNVLAWLLQAPSPRGVLAWLDLDRTVSRTAHPPADGYLQDVDVLLTSKLPYDAALTALFQEAYGDAMEKDFILVKETTYWRIYQRRPG